MAADASIRVDTRVENSDLKKLQKDFDRLEAKLENLHRKGAKFEALGVDKQSKQWKGLLVDIAQVEGDLYEVTEAINAINDAKSGNAFTRLKDSSKKFFKAIKVGTKESNGLLSTLGSRLKGIALSLLVFNWITKGFNAMVSAMKEGFQNLAHYSDDYNESMSALKGQSEQLKNSLAAAFEPVANMIIPYITQLVSWLNTAAETVSKFIAVLQGKSTYTKAKKQVVDYAKSLDSASKSAKGALAAFDSLNVLEQNDNNASSSSELSGADAFETVTLTDEDMQIVDLLKEKLQEILGILLLAGLALSAFGVGGPLATFAGALLMILGLLQLVLSYMDAWSNGISFDNLKGMLTGLLAVILGIYLLFGPIVAGVAAIAGGIALVVLAIKDMLENGVNAQNSLTLAIGLVTALVGIFVVFGSTVGVIVAAIVAVVAAFATFIAIAGNGEEALATLKSMCVNFADFFKKIFAGDIEGAMESLKAGGKDLVNVLIIAFESLVNCLIKGLNWLIEKINSISFDIPDWIPGIGGETFGFNLPSVQEVSLPRLANGTVIQGGRPFAAILGDQRYGQTNIETPLPTMIEAFKQANAEMGTNRGYSGPVYLQVDGKTFAKLELPYFKGEEQRIGVSLSVT